MHVIIADFITCTLSDVYSGYYGGNSHVCVCVRVFVCVCACVCARTSVATCIIFKMFGTCLWCLYGTKCPNKLLKWNIHATVRELGRWWWIHIRLYNGLASNTRQLAIFWPNDSLGPLIMYVPLGMGPPCITTAIWRCRKLISKWQCSIHLKAAPSQNAGKITEFWHVTHIYQSRVHRSISCYRTACYSYVVLLYVVKASMYLQQAIKEQFKKATCATISPYIVSFLFRSHVH